MTSSRPTPAPHAYCLPVVREIPRPAAAISGSSAW
jgi:hypothetical protein